MSRSDNRYQAERWLTTGTEDLRASEALSSAGLYAQARFQAQQAGEKAVKALWYLVDADPWGHSVFRLISDFPEKAGITDLDVWLEKARVLDKFYIPTRYPNGLPDLTPGQIYGIRRCKVRDRSRAVLCGEMQRIDSDPLTALPARRPLSQNTARCPREHMSYIFLNAYLPLQFPITSDAPPGPEVAHPIS